eukprot:SAG31_NODE_7158_length_1771_cov_1.354067_1_plen_253_part_00
MSSCTDCVKRILFTLNVIDFCMGAGICLYGLFLLLPMHLLEDFPRAAYLWVAAFVLGGVLILTVFLSACGVWASRTCGCCLPFSSALGLLVMILEVALATATLFLEADVEDILRETIDDANGVLPDGSEGGQNSTSHKDLIPQNLVAEYNRYSTVFATVLYGLAILQVVRFVMGKCFRNGTQSDLQQPFNSADLGGIDDLADRRGPNIREQVRGIREHNRWLREREQSYKIDLRADNRNIQMDEGKSNCIVY